MIAEDQEFVNQIMNSKEGGKDDKEDQANKVSGPKQYFFEMFIYARVTEYIPDIFFQADYLNLVQCETLDNLKLHLQS